MKQWMAITIGVAVCVASSGCARSTKVVAQDKEYVPPSSASAWTIGGVFDSEDDSIAISVNGESVLRARFPPFTPRLTAEGKYNDLSVATLCKFSSGIIASKRGGWQERVAESIVAKATKSGGNTCDVTVDGQAAATLYF
ncbi:hypothetical protein [Povalibacter sp.]|uniref:hypothetical protein n=1 Tax=Povalibacter sp. TaxID=1962978 RepID=UPI002F3E7AC7